MVKFRVSRLDGVEGGDVEADGGEGGDPTEPVVIKGGVVYEEPTPDDLPPDPGPEDPYPRTPDEEYDEFANRILKATLQLVNDLRTNRQRETSVDVVDLDLAGSTRLVYSLLEQNFQVAVNPSTLPKQHRDIPWPALVAAHPGIDNSATQALQALQREFNQPMKVVAQARKNVAPLWTQALPWPTPTPSPRQIDGAGQVFEQTQAPAEPWPVAPTQPDVGYDARTQQIEWQNEARLQAYVQQQAARQQVALSTPQPHNPYGWLAQRMGNLFSPAAYAAPVPQRPAPAATQLQGRVSYTQPAPAIPTLGEPAIWQALLKGQVITDREFRQLFHTLDMASYQPASTHQAKVYKALARELLLRNQLAGTTVNDDGELVVNGTAMTRQQASLYYGDALDKRLDKNEELQPKAWLKGYLQQREYDRIKAVDSEGVRDVTLALLADIPLPQLRALKAVPLLRHLHTARKLLEVSNDLGVMRVPEGWPSNSEVPEYKELYRRYFKVWA